MTQLFYSQKDSYGYPIPGTMMSTRLSAIPKNTFAILPQDYTASDSFQLVKAHFGGLRYFVRKKSTGEIIPNSLFISVDQPSSLVYELKVFYNIPGIGSISDISGAGLNAAPATYSSGLSQAVTFYHISSTVTFSLNSLHFELSADGTTWVTTGSITMNATGTDPFTKTLYIRTKPNSPGTTVDTLTISSPNATSVTATVTAVIA